MLRMKNLTVKNKATSNSYLLLCSCTLQQPPLQTLSPYTTATVTALGSRGRVAIGNSARNLKVIGVTGVIPKSSWCYSSSVRRKRIRKRKNSKYHVETPNSLLGRLYFLHKSTETLHGSSQFSSNT